ncbi:MAG: cyclic-di-AMP receptor [Anaerolineae bacterium]|nr:cyclic-di-AMP receptor [Anaerolineae bacterium]
MKLLISVINSDDAHPLVDALMGDGYRATTISTTGGFLREGNATLLIGVADEDVEKVLKIIKDNCHTRTQYVNPLPPTMESGELYMPTPIEVQVGGAVVFILDVDRFERF